jgi:hypothetical protein
MYSHVKHACKSRRQLQFSDRGLGKSQQSCLLSVLSASPATARKATHTIHKLRALYTMALLDDTRNQHTMSSIKTAGLIQLI